MFCFNGINFRLVSQISDLLGRDTALCNTLWMLKDAAQKTFFDILKTRGEKLLRYPPPIAVDLSPPPAVREGVSLTLEIIETYNSMMVSTSGKKPDFDPVLSALLDPIIKVFQKKKIVLFPDEIKKFDLYYNRLPYDLCL